MAQEMNSRMTKKQLILVLLWLPMHMLILPLALYILIRRGLLGNANADLLVYAIGAVYMLLVLRRFFRRDFDPIWEHPFLTPLMVVGAYYLSLFGLLLVSLLMEALGVVGENENTQAVTEMAMTNLGPTTAMAVFLAPIVEESIFRAGIFGALRRKNRFLAYAVSTLAFGLYHVWDGALFVDPIQLVYILQYVPSSLALAYLYERTDSIWSSIFLHMLTNGVSLWALLHP